jgi:hypothetical protein
MTISELRKLFEGYKASLPELARDCEQCVADWRWATDLMVSYEPLHDLVTRQCGYWRLPERKWVAKESDALYGATQHGFDREGRLRVWRYRNAPAHYLVYGENVVDEVFDSQVFAVTRYYSENGVVIAQYHASRHGCSEELFERANGLYRASTLRLCDYDDEDFSACRYLDQKSFVYDDHGDLDRVVKQPEQNGEHLQDELLFIRPRGETLAATLHELEEFLVVQIPESIRSLSLNDAVYCIAISYCGEDFFWPTTMCIGTELSRTKLVEAVPPERRYEALIPGEWPEPKREPRLWVPSADAQAQELQLRSFQLIDAPSAWLEGEAIRPARELLQRVAARLMRIDWSPIAPTTDDFAVFAIDDTGEFAADVDLRASLPAERLALLRERGYLWFI